LSSARPSDGGSGEIVANMAQLTENKPMNPLKLMTERILGVIMVTKPYA
jgi:hypothetical protein